MGVGGVFVFVWGNGDLLYVGSLNGTVRQFNGRDARDTQFVGGGSEFVGVVKVYCLAGESAAAIFFGHYLKKSRGKFYRGIVLRFG